VANSGSTTLSVINTDTQLVVATIPLPSPTPGGIVAFGPVDVAFAPDGKHAYVGTSTNQVLVIDTALKSVAVADTIVLSATRNSLTITPPGIAVTPDGAFAYVSNFSSGTVAIINLTTNMVSSIAAPASEGVAITPDGTFAYVAGTSGITVIDTGTQTVKASVTNLMPSPAGVAITPDGLRAYCSQPGNGSNDQLTVIQTALPVKATNVIMTDAHSRGLAGIAFAPDGAFAYVANNDSDTVSVIQTAVPPGITTTIPVGQAPMGVAVTADGAFAYVTNFQSGSVSVIDTSTNTVAATLAVGAGPNGVAIAMVTNGCLPCVGECDGQNGVTSDELLTGVQIALGGSVVNTCAAFDANRDHAVTVDEIITAVNNALTGCP